MAQQPLLQRGKRFERCTGRQRRGVREPCPVVPDPPAELRAARYIKLKLMKLGSLERLERRITAELQSVLSVSARVRLVGR